MTELLSRSPEETERWAAILGTLVKTADVVGLSGELGAGKTTFVRGLARGLGCGARVLSPTFMVVREHTDGRIPLYHMDLYRLDGGDAFELGLEDYFSADGVVAVEWPERAAGLIPDERLEVDLTFTGESERTLRLAARGARAESLLREWIGAVGPGAAEGGRR